MSCKLEFCQVYLMQGNPHLLVYEKKIITLKEMVAHLADFISRCILVIKLVRSAVLVLNNLHKVGQRQTQDRGRLGRGKLGCRQPWKEREKEGRRCRQP